MTERKKILIISCSAGNGHTKAAEALKKTAELYYPNLEVKHINCVDYMDFFTKKILIDSYNKLANKFPKFWSLIYQITDHPLQTKFFIYTWLIEASEKINGKKLISYIKSYQPDYTICTHFSPASVIAKYQKNQTHITKLGFVITDYTFHYFWNVGNETDYFVANEELKKNLILKHQIKESSLTTTGIPIDPEFFNNQTTPILNNPPQPNTNKTILLFANGQKNKNIIEIVKQIKNSALPVRIIVLGKNINLPKNLNDKNFISLVGWTTDVPKYLKTADIIISKSGGLIVSECLALNKPLITLNPLPGLEEANAKFLEEKKLGITCQNEKNISFCLKYFLNQKPVVLEPAINSAKLILDKISS